MVWALRTVFLLISDSDWEPGGLLDPPPPPRPFDAFEPEVLSLANPLRIVRAPSVPPRRGKVRLA